jgi:putative flippase GtrA
MKTVHKFLLLGVFSTAVDYILYTIAILVGINYVVAIILGYSAGLIANYIIGRSFVFTSGHKLKNSKYEFAAVVFIAILGALFTILIVKILSYSLFHMNPLLSRPIAIVIVFFWNYFIRKVFVYNPVSI